jgi:uncharacterized integral membrane protein
MPPHNALRHHRRCRRDLAADATSEKLRIQRDCDYGRRSLRFASAGHEQRQNVATQPPPPDGAPQLERGQERRRDRAGRYARRTWLYTWTGLLIASLVLLVILVAENTRRVKVGWIFGYSHISLVFLVLFATVLGWVLGVATSVIFRRRTRRPR